MFNDFEGPLNIKSDTWNFLCDLTLYKGMGKSVCGDSKIYLTKN